MGTVILPVVGVVVPMAVVVLVLLALGSPLAHRVGAWLLVKVTEPEDPHYDNPDTYGTLPEHDTDY
jgi:hypothetical protein